jgi:hypothetical protein
MHHTSSPGVFLCQVYATEQTKWQGYMWYDSGNKKLIFQEYWFSKQCLWRLLSSAMWHNVVLWMFTPTPKLQYHVPDDISHERILVSRNGNLVDPWSNFLYRRDFVGAQKLSIKFNELPVSMQVSFSVLQLGRFHNPYSSLIIVNHLHATDVCNRE